MSGGFYVPGQQLFTRKVEYILEVNAILAAAQQQQPVASLAVLSERLDKYGLNDLPKDGSDERVATLVAIKNLLLNESQALAQLSRDIDALKPTGAEVEQAVKDYLNHDTNAMERLKQARAALNQRSSALVQSIRTLLLTYARLEDEAFSKYVALATRELPLQTLDATVKREEIVH